MKPLLNHSSKDQFVNLRYYAMDPVDGQRMSWEIWEEGEWRVDEQRIGWDIWEKDVRR